MKGKDNNLSERISYLDFLKVIALIGIITAHVSPPASVFMLRNFDVVLMVSISAFLGGKSYKRRNQSLDENKRNPLKSYISYFISRFRRLVIPTWILITVYFVYQSLKGNFYSIKYYTASFLLTRYGMGYVWIVLIFLYVALMIPIFCRYEKDKETVFSVVLILYLAYEVLCFLGIGADSKLLNCTLFYIIPYGFIAFMGMNYSEFSDGTKKKTIFGSFLVFFALLSAYRIKTGTIQDVQIAKYPPRAYYLSYGLFVSYVLMFICEHHYSKIYENKFIRFISVHSLGIYLCHVMTLEFYKLLKLPGNWLLELVVIFVGSTATVWIWTKIGKKGKVCTVSLILLILVSYVGASVISYKGFFTKLENVYRPTAAGSSSFEEKEELEELMNLNLKYILNDWWNEEKQGVFAASSNTAETEDYGLTGTKKELADKSTESFKNWKTEQYLSIAFDLSNQENSIRPISHAGYCIAASLYFGYYDESVTGIPAEDAKNMAVKLIASAAKEYKSNQYKGWGCKWQSPLWAENLGVAAWMLWDDFEKQDQKNITKMILNEADYVMNDYDIPYYMNSEGEVVYIGDTKGEEIAWCSKILSLTSAMFPENKHADEWNKKLVQMLIASTAMPEDVKSNKIVDGIVVGEVLNGSNLNPDGTVYNHNLIHIDYMTTIVEEMAETAVVYSLAGKSVPEAATFNIDKIYNALINVDLGSYDSNKNGEHFYERDANGNPTGNVTMPAGSDWGGSWYANCFLTDVYADVMNLDDQIEEKYKASIWANLHLEKVQEQINKQNEDGEVTGQFFQEGENNFVSGELFQAHNLVEAYILFSAFNNN